MDKEIKLESGKQFIKYFKIWFIVIAVLLIMAIVTAFIHAGREKVVRMNTYAPTERVYDEANVLTDKEEKLLRELIYKTENKIKADIVLVTRNSIMEGSGAASDSTWEDNMMNAADDFYDQNRYGYNREYGDGLLILDNWYTGQAGTWLSTCGSMVDIFKSYETDRVLDAIYYNIDAGAYDAYSAGIETIEQIVAGDKTEIETGTFMLGSFIISTVAALIFVFLKLKNKEGSKTVTISTYLDGTPVENLSRDQFIRRVVTQRKIPKQTNHSGGSSVGRSGGGSHRSSGGVRHGGGGRRR